MKTKEELNELKKEVVVMNEKLAELSEDELKEVAGGKDGGITLLCGCIANPNCEDNNPFGTRKPNFSITDAGIMR